MGILIVDDVELNRKILAVNLENRYELWEAGNGFEALKILQREYNHISLIILDIVMPVMDGFEFLEKVKEKKQFKDIPIIFVTAHSSEENVLKGLQEGVCDVIAKPFDPYLIRHRVSQLIHLAEQRAQQQSSAVQPSQPPVKPPATMALVVDDLEINRVTLKLALKKRYEVLTAESGRQALTLLEEYSKRIAVVLLDIVMPVMDGIEMLDLAKRKGLLDRVPVIAITEEESPAKIKRMKELGICEIVPRPFAPAVIRNRVKNMIELYAK